jgi:hypothetical protein
MTIRRIRFLRPLLTVRAQSKDRQQAPTQGKVNNRSNWLGGLGVKDLWTRWKILRRYSVGLCICLMIRYYMLDVLTVWIPVQPDTFLGRLTVGCSLVSIYATNHDHVHLFISLQSIFISTMCAKITQSTLGSSSCRSAGYPPNLNCR